MTLPAAARQRTAPGPGGPAPKPGPKYRLRLAKRGAARFLSHLDTLRALLRALRRSGLPVALSQGFNPHLQIAFASALALGMESEAEFVDVELTEPVRLAEIASSLSRALPPGFELREVRGIPPRCRALASYNSVSRYIARGMPVSAGEDGCSAGRAGPPGHEDRIAEDLRERTEELLRRAELPVERQQGKLINLRPLIYSLRVSAPGGAGSGGAGPGGTGREPTGTSLELELLGGPGGTARVDDVLRLLELDPAEWSVLKTDFWPLVDGAKTSPWGA